MMSRQLTEDMACKEMQLLLSDYLENSLSARRMWEVEKHLATCASCAAQAHQMQQTVQLLRTAEVFDTGPDFMAKLHARLDGLEPEPIRRTPWTALRDWAADVRERVRIRPVQALSFGMASLALVMVLVVGIHPDHTQGTNVPTSPPAPLAISQAARVGNVAVTASDPFDDPAAAKLESDD